MQGESGTEKSWWPAPFTRSRLAPAPFVAVNCAAITESLLESELLGTPGAFTAVRARRGC